MGTESYPPDSDGFGIGAPGPTILIRTPDSNIAGAQFPDLQNEINALVKLCRQARSPVRA
jgi:hypothetical protein